MEGGKRIELSLTQEPGEFRLNLDGMAITIQMNPAAREQAAREGGESSTRAARPPAPETGPGLSQAEAQDIERLLNELNHYRHVSQEIYEGLGKLAKDINLSIQDLSLAELIQTTMGSPGEHLDQARNQVTDVLLMTEQATLNIMDLVEEIREDCQTVQTSLLSLTESSPAPEAELAPEDASGGEEEQRLWDQVLSQAEAFDRLLHPGEAGGGSVQEQVPFFSLAEVLQIILEFCTNEKVKQHLKAVQSKQDAIFQGPEAEQALSLLAAGATQADGFYQLPLTPVLELLKSHCDDERVKELFTKMATSADKLFPVTALPLEAKEMEEAFPEDPPEFQGNPEMESGWEELRRTLGLLSEQRQAAPGAGARTSGPREAADVQKVLDTVNRITQNLSRIIEALSFQDLSGQRLLKILKIIRQLQVQVLTLLVAAGDRLPTKLDDQAIAPPQSDQAREELDRLLTSVVPSENQSAAVAPEEQPLDQNAVNDILTSMGF